MAPPSVSLNRITLVLSRDSVRLAGSLGWVTGGPGARSVDTEAMLATGLGSQSTSEVRPGVGFIVEALIGRGTGSGSPSSAGYTQRDRTEK